MRKPIRNKNIEDCCIVNEVRTLSERITGPQADRFQKRNTV